MSDDTTTEFTEQDQLDLDSLGNVEDLKHTLLEMWRDVLSNVEGSLATRPTPAIANRIIGSWTKLSFQDIPDYHLIYHTHLVELRDILDEIIAENPGAFANVGERGADDSDGVANRDIYLELFVRWQEKIQEWEYRWNAASSISHIEVAAIADASSFFLGNQGLITHLDQIGLQYTPAEAEVHQERLEAARLALVNGE